MDNRSMMELEDELDAKFNDLVNYCMVSGAIDQNLYTEYDVKRGQRFRMSLVMNWQRERRFPAMVNCIIRDIM